MQIGTKDCIVETCMNKLENLDFLFSQNLPFLFSFFICLNLIILSFNDLDSNVDIWKDDELS